MRRLRLNVGLALLVWAMLSGYALLTAWIQGVHWTRAITALIGAAIGPAIGLALHWALARD